MLEYLNTFYSNITYFDDSFVIGIDEAGRGPVLGPMVYAVYIMPKTLKTVYKDSKLLTPRQRTDFFSTMVNYAYISIDPVYITSHMEGNSKNLNTIAKETVVLLLKEVKDKICTSTVSQNSISVYIDGLGNNESYKSYLQKYFDFNFIVENKADSKYQVVSGASIVAKCIRDGVVKNLNSRASTVCSTVSSDLGSGYPSDPTTKKWLRVNHSPLGFPKFVRHSWKTIKNLLPCVQGRKLENSLSGFYTGPLK